jgi:AmpD protein
VVQYVSCNDRAWHAGVSEFKGRKGCNDFAIGIELEGTDSSGYTDEQYQQLILLTLELMAQYPMIKINNIVGHSDIAPGRKTDPGFSFDWSRFQQAIATV